MLFATIVRADTKMRLTSRRFSQGRWELTASITSVRDKRLNIRLHSAEQDSEITKKPCSVSRRPLDIYLLPSARRLTIPCRSLIPWIPYLELGSVIAGHWVKLQGERCSVYIAEPAQGGNYFTWCDDPQARVVEAYSNPVAAIQAGLRRAARPDLKQNEGRDQP